MKKHFMLQFNTDCVGSFRNNYIVHKLKFGMDITTKYSDFVLGKVA